jgi:hypothetical protein
MKSYLVLISLLLIGCGDNESSSKAPPTVAAAAVAPPAASVKESPATNVAENATPTALIPKFILACSYGSQNSNNKNRFVSDGVDIHFGHESGSAFSRGKDIKVTDRIISFRQTEPDGSIYSSNIITELHRDTLKIWVTRIDFTGKEEQQLYFCEINEYDESLVNIIKSDFDLKKKKLLDEKRAYESRPNKI